jgi:hypothetical protein
VDARRGVASSRATSKRSPARLPPQRAPARSAPAPPRATPQSPRRAPPVACAPRSAGASTRAARSHFAQPETRRPTRLLRRLRLSERVPPPGVRLRQRRSVAAPAPRQCDSARHGCARRRRAVPARRVCSTRSDARQRRAGGSGQRRRRCRQHGLACARSLAGCLFGVPMRHIRCVPAVSVDDDRRAVRRRSSLSSRRSSVLRPSPHAARTAAPSTAPACRRPAQAVHPRRAVARLNPSDEMSSAGAAKAKARSGARARDARGARGARAHYAQPRVARVHPTRMRAPLRSWAGR